MLKTKLSNRFSTILRITFSILSIFLIFGFFRWAGVSGVISFILGLAFMAYLFLSKNMLVQVLLDKFEGNEYIDEVMKKNGRSQ